MRLFIFLFDITYARCKSKAHVTVGRPIFLFPSVGDNFIENVLHLNYISLNKALLNFYDSTNIYKT